MSLLIYSPELHKYRRGGKHPAQPDKIRRAQLLLSAYGALDGAGVAVLAPREATVDELACFHTREYIAAVRQLSDHAQDPTLPERVPPGAFGFGNGGNPAYPGMYHSAALRAGGAFQAVDALLDGPYTHVLHFAGGQHHARPARTSGFCIFNDVVLAIQVSVARGRRVAYVDIDAHHGDGVQDAFYADSRVLTISLHETGQTLYPGTGAVTEMGEGEGFGFALNMPFARDTDDDTYVAAFEQIVPQALSAFRPDALVTQFGADAHFEDPLAHLALTTRGFSELARVVHSLSPGRWLSFGGGGYRESVSPRVWAILWGEMSGHELPDALPPEYLAELPEPQYLYDRRVPALDDETLTRARAFAAEGVAFLRAHHPLLTDSAPGEVIPGFSE